MAITYKKNAKNVYMIPLYNYFWFWWFIVFILSLFVSIFYVLFKLNFFFWGMFLLWSLVLILTISRAYSLTKSVIKAKTIGKYITQTNSERAVTKSLLATMSVNRLQDTPYISVPSVTVCDSRPSHITVEIEKLAGMYDIDKMTEDINSSFRGSLGNYAVTSEMITTDGLFYKFVLEDVATDKTFRPATIDDIKADKYKIKLQSGLTVDLSERAHIAVWGKTGSKKTTVLFSIILQLLTMGADIRFIDGKDEFSAFKSFYPAEKIASDIERVFEQLENILDIVKERQKIMANEVQKQQKIGLKASDVGLCPVVVVADEIGSIVALMDTKQAKKFISDIVAIIQRGRSVGVSVIASTQDPSTDTLPQKVRQQFSTRILLGSANSDIQRMAFGDVATAGDVEDFRGFYVCDGLTNQPMKFYVCDLYSNGFNELGVFKKACQIGLEVDY